MYFLAPRFKEPTSMGGREGGRGDRGKLCGDTDADVGVGSDQVDLLHLMMEDKNTKEELSRYFP